MGEADRLTMAGGTPEAVLMERAGAAVAREIVARWPGRRVVVLCGPGNNVGDGRVMARLLLAAGWSVRVVALEQVSPDCLGDAGLVVDALFGAGLSRAVTGAARDTLLAAAGRRIPIVAVDVPSGVAGDSGADLGAVRADLTVTFFRRKPGHVLLPGRVLCGEVVVADIGISGDVLAALGVDTFANDPRLWLASLPRPGVDGHKYSRGHALVSAGSVMTGAARLAGRAAARAGAGLVSLACARSVWPVYAAGLLSVMVHPLDDEAGFGRLLADRRHSALLIGPGAGVGATTRGRALAMLATGRATLLDADALTSFQDAPGALDDAIMGPCVLTPHEGEFGRLFDVAGDKLERARRAAARSKAVVVLKGADTVVAAPDGRAVVNTNAPPTLATAGSGDVLAGMIVGLLAQGMAPFAAACAGVWLHGACAASFGPGLIAEDLAECLPAVLRGVWDGGLAHSDDLSDDFGSFS